MPDSPELVAELERRSGRLGPNPPPPPDPLMQLAPEKLTLARKYYSDDEIRARLRGSGTDTPPEEQGAGAPWQDRLAASFKSMPEERVAYYKSKYPDLVSVSPGGEILISGKSVNKPGLDWGDVAGLGGDIPELLGVVGGGIAGGVPGAAAGAAAGNVVKQAVGSMIPGDSSQDVVDRGGEVVKSAVGGAAAQALGGMRPSTLSPTGIIRDYTRKRMERLGTSEAATEAGQIAERTGFPLNVAEATNDPWMKMILGFAYRNAYGQEYAALDQAAKDRASLAFLKRMSGKLGQAGGFQNKDFTDAAANAARASVRDIEGQLAKVSKEDYGFLAGPLGEQNTIVPTKHNQLIEATAKYYEGMQTQEGVQAAKQLRGMLRMPGRQQPPIAEAGLLPADAGSTLNPRAVQEKLSAYGKDAFGNLPEDFYKQLKSANGRRLDKELWGALRDDLKDAAAAGDAGAAQLLKARGRTEELHTLREQLAQVPLLDFLRSKGMLNEVMAGGKPFAMETVGPAIVRGMRAAPGEPNWISPQEISNMTKLLSQASPSFADDFARMIVDNAVKAGKYSGGEGIRTARFSFEDAYKALPPPHYLQAIYQDTWNPGTRTSGIAIANDLAMLMKGIQRAQQVGLGIPQSPGHTVVGITGHLLEGNLGAAFKQVLAQVLFPKTVGTLAMNPGLRKEISGAVTAAPTAPAPGFLGRYIDKALPAALYEVGSAVQRQNRGETGQ